MTPASLVAQFGPYAATAIVAGALGMNFRLFFVTGLVGRCLRLILVVESPHAIMGLFR
jgi:membrane protein YqaA with SNARE-associated domain